MARSSVPSSQKPEFIIDKESIKEARFIFRAVSHPIRQKLLLLLDRNIEMKVTDIYKKLRRTQSETSMHLAILRKAGAVNFRREGKKIIYSVNHERMAELQEKAAGLISLL